MKVRQCFALSIFISTLIGITIAPRTYSQSPLFPFPTFYQVGNGVIGDGVYAMAIADLNGDGFVDAAVTNALSHDVAVLLNLGDGSFGSPQYLSTAGIPRGIQAADVTGDGLIDLVIAFEGNPPGVNDTLPKGGVTVHPGLGAGEFAPFSHYSANHGPQRLALGDLDNDGDLDVVAVNSLIEPSIAVLLNLGDGSFGRAFEHFSGSFPQSPVIADLDSNEFLDVVIPTGSGAGGLRILFNNGDGLGAFTDNELIPFDFPGVPFAAVVFDIDRDGDQDILADVDTFELILHENLGRRQFQRRSVSPSQFVGQPMFVGDFDLDGTPDVVTMSEIPAPQGFFQPDIPSLTLFQNLNEELVALQQIPVNAFPDPLAGVRNPVLIDLDNDGDLDLIAPVGFASNNQLFEGGGDAIAVMLNSLPALPGDVTGDRAVDGRDIARVLSQWGAPGDADLTGDGVVDVGDLVIILAHLAPIPD